MARFLLCTAFFALTQLVAGCGEPVSPATLNSHRTAKRAPAPVLLVVIDTLRSDHLGAYGYGRPTSPHLDALALEGVLFEEAYAQSTWTKPSTASILTGQYPAVHGVMQVFSTLPTSVRTMAEVLHRGGYGTSAVVANGFVSNRDSGFRRGFDRFEDCEDLKDGFAYARAEKVVDRAIQFLTESLAANPEQPFFLYVHVVDPHLPYDPPEPWRERFVREYGGRVSGYFGSDAEPGAPEELGPDDLAHLKDLYDAEIAYTDHQLQRLFDDLKARGLWEETLVLVVADHGEEFLDHGGLKHGPTMYQELVHVPLIVKPPHGRGFPQGQRSPRTAMQVDLLPTVLDVIGHESGLEFPGVSLLARAMDDPTTPNSPAFAQVDQKGVLRTMVVQDSHKYVHQLVPSSKDLLFDLAADPGERNNTAGREEALRRRMSTLLKRYTDLDRRGAAFALVVVNHGSETIEVRLDLGTESQHLSALQPLALELNPQASDSAQAGHDEALGQTEETLDDLPLFVTSARLRTAAGDRDGITFLPSEADATVLVNLLVNGRAPAPGTVRLGPEGTPAETFPLRLERDDSTLVALDPTRETPPRDETFAIYIWRRPSFRSEEVELDEASVDAMRQLGYFGDDE